MWSSATFCQMPLKQTLLFPLSDAARGRPLATASALRGGRPIHARAAHARAAHRPPHRLRAGQPQRGLRGDRVGVGGLPDPVRRPPLRGPMLLPPGARGEPHEPRHRGQHHPLLRQWSGERPKPGVRPNGLRDFGRPLLRRRRDRHSEALRQNDCDAVRLSVDPPRGCLGGPSGVPRGAAPFSSLSGVPSGVELNREQKTTPQNCPIN